MRFNRNTLELVECATGILEAEYPMTLRQLYYRVVSAGVLSNDQRSYNRLGRAMTRLREAGGIPRTWIVDHIRQTLKPSSWSGLADYGESVRECYRRNFWASLPDHVEVFVEKDAVAGTVEPVTDGYDINLRVLRGFSSISFAGGIADEWRDIKKNIYAYYLGDFDPSGMDTERDIKAKLHRYSGRYLWPDDYGGDYESRVQAYARGGPVYWHRLGILPEDFDDFDLIPLPAKISDTRYGAFVDEHGAECAELDALPPTELRRRVEEAITEHIDQDEWERLQLIEQREQEAMNAAVERWSGLKA